MSDFRNDIIRRLNASMEAGGMSAASVRVERRGELLMDWTGGRLHFQEGAPQVTDESVFMIASITKPMTATGVAKLIERGDIDLDDTVASYVPEFSASGKESVTLRHCFTHTSGLPYMVPDNHELIKASAPPEEFVASVNRTHLRFPPGTDWRYSGPGAVMLGEVGERVTGTPFREYLSDTLFRPAGMGSTHLGWREDFEGRCVATKEDHPWNTPYFRGLGAPNSGAFSTAADIARLFRLMLDGGGAQDGRQVLAPGTVRLMLSDHTGAMPTLSEEARLGNGFGLGWCIQRLGARASTTSGPESTSWLGALVPPGAFGHAGATGTLAWADPSSGVIVIILTNGMTDPDRRAIRASSNIAAAALC